MIWSAFYLSMFHLVETETRRERAPLPATALRDSRTSSQRCGSHYCPAAAPRHGKAWNNVDPKPRTWSWNLLSWCGICSFSHTLQDQVTKSASCGMLVAHFPNHCLAHKSWPTTKVTRVQNGLSIPSQRLPNCIVFCPPPKIGDNRI